MFETYYLKPLFISQKNITLLYNFEKNKRPYFEEAILLYNEEIGKDSGIYIKDRAYSLHGAHITGYNALHRSDNRDKSRFWRIYELIRDGHHTKEKHLNLKLAILNAEAALLQFELDHKKELGL